ncbi:metallophosphoesterase family protein [Labrys neptuniae]
MVHKKKTGLVAALVAFWALCSPALAADQFQWVQYGPEGLEARAITEKAACPGGLIDGHQTEMAVRSTPGQDYPILVCSMPIPAGAKDVRVDGVPVPLPKAQPNRILVIGDTGCRLKGKQVQACNDISQWPFRIGADISSEFKPDLVLHVGDFHYRETACPIDNKGCAGTPFGDSWAVWRADFFSPGETLLKTAPWIFVRGNHEECERGGKGWARTLDPYPWSADAGKTGCLGPAKPFLVDLGGVKLGIVDVSTADEAKVNEQQVAWYKSAFSTVIDAAGQGPLWLAFHRPAWVTDGSAGQNSGGDNKTLAAALKDTLKPNVQALISGHHHVFEAMGYEQDLPVALISGHGGDDFSPDVPKNLIGLMVNGATIKSGIARPGIYGFAMLERASDGSGGWTFTGYDIHGKQIGQCAVAGRSLDCH